MKRLTKKLYFLTALLVPLSVFFFAWAYPKSEPHDNHPKYLTVYYRGFDTYYFPINLSILDKQYYKIVAGDGTYGWAETEYYRPGFNKHRAYYKNGTIKLKLKQIFM